jgi:fatty-acyl-CoA synthase
MIRASDWVAFHADRTPDAVAMIDEATARTFTYAQFEQRVSHLAGFLASEWHVQPGDVIAILAKNRSEYFEVEFACIRLGALMLPLNWRLALPELEFILTDSHARVLIADAEFLDQVEPLLHLDGLDNALIIIQPGDPATPYPEYEAVIAAGHVGPELAASATHDTAMTIMYTAGTTGHPKGVIITHGMTFWNAVNITVPTGLSHTSRQYSVLPMFHTGGLNLYANPLFHLGGSVVIAREFDAGHTLQVLSDPELGITHFFGVPSIYLFLSQHPDFAAADLTHVQSWGCGGAPMPVALLELYAARGIIVQLGFGMTETSPTTFLIDKRRALEKPASVGRPLLHTRVRVVDENFYDVPVGGIGEVVISGPNVTPGYLNRPDANEASFTRDEIGYRWLHSGDAGTIDDDGCIYIVDRYKDMYISGGENVYPAEVEQVLFHIPAVADAAVIGVADVRWGEAGLAVIVRNADAALSTDEIFAHCRANLAKYKVPKHIVFADSLPRNAAGKVLKRELKIRYGGKI